MTENRLYDTAEGGDPDNQICFFVACVLGGASTLVEGMDSQQEIADFIGIPLDEYTAWWENFLRPLNADDNPTDQAWTDLSSLCNAVVKVWCHRGTVDPESDASPYQVLQDIQVAVAIDAPEVWKSHLPEVTETSHENIKVGYMKACEAYAKLQTLWVEYVKDDPAWNN